MLCNDKKQSIQINQQLRFHFPKVSHPKATMMNAILVFDPTNDLLFVKSNRLFKKRVYKYSRSNGLLSPPAICTTVPHHHHATSSRKMANSKRHKIGTPPTTSSDSSSFSTTSSNSSSSINLDNRKELNFKRFAKLKRHRRQQQPVDKRRARNSLATDIDCNASDDELDGSKYKSKSAQVNDSRRWEDTSKSFIDCLMLMLTPYVASLRLSTNLSSFQDKFKQEDAKTSKESSKTKSMSSASTSNTMQTNDNHLLEPRQQKQEDSDLLAKFMSSINLNHECRNLESSNEYDGTDICDDQNFASISSGRDQQSRVAPEDSVSKLENGDYCEDFAPRKFATSQVPIDCLKDCQIVYCELYDFIFIYMQELELVSSFKMRLLQKRIDIFARLSLLLLGPSLNSIRYHENPDQSNFSPLPIVNQAKILRIAYDVWLDHQFESHFLLEANERLILGKHIRNLTREALKKISIQLRSAALLPTLTTSPATSFTSLADESGSTRSRGQSLAAQFHSNYSSETHMHAILYSGDKLVSQFSCRNSQPLNADDLILILLLLKTFNLHYDNIVSENHDDDNNDDGEGEDFISASSFRVPDYCYRSHYNADRNTQKIKPLAPSSIGSKSVRTTRSNRSLGGSSQSNVTTTNSLPSVKQDHKSTKKSKLPTQFPIFLSTGGKFQERLRVPHMIRFIKLTQGVTLILISEISSISYLCLQLHRVLRICHEFTSRSPQIKLNQLSRINDCVAAIKTYFHNPSLEFKLRAGSSSLGAATRPADLAEEVEGVGGEDDTHCTESGRVNAPTRGVLGSILGKYLSKSKPNVGSQVIAKQQQHQQSGYIHQFKRIENQFSRLSLFNSLSENERRQCCQLICRLDDLISSNLHTYMRQTFSLPVVEHKREALLTCVSSTLRDSIDTFILQPQIEKLNEPWNLEQRQVLDLMDEIKLMARMELSDYLDYLAIKSTCNLTLGAPLTHDMLAIRSFIYVDRSRQEFLASPMRSSGGKSSRDSLLEGDFFSTLSREMDGDGDSTDSEAGSSSSTGNDSHEDDNDDCSSTSPPKSSSDSEKQQQSSDDSTKSSSLSSGRSVICVRDLKPKVESDKKPAIPLARNKTLPRFIDDHSKPKAGSSGSLVMTNSSSAATTTSDLQLSSNLSTAQWTSNEPLPSQLKEGKHFSSLRSELNVGDLDYNRELKHQSVCDTDTLLQMQQKHQLQPRLVDEKLMKGFNCFIYNRLAQGQTSYISSSSSSSSTASDYADSNQRSGPRNLKDDPVDSQEYKQQVDSATGYVYSYFLWFKRQTVRSSNLDTSLKTLPCLVPEVIYSQSLLDSDVMVDDVDANVEQHSPLPRLI